MSKLDIAGLWVGEYDYDPRPDFDLGGPVSFTLTATPGWFGLFRGVINEDVNKGAPEPATVRGHVVGRTIRFKKWYSKIYVADGAKWISLEESIERVHESVADEAIPPTAILYRGVYDSANETIAGDWKTEEMQIRFASQGRLMHVQYGGTTGTWFARRKTQV